MTLQKEEFLNQLRIKSISAEKNRDDLTVIDSDEFYSSNNPEMDIELNLSELDWDGDYFDTLLGSLDRESFTQERCLHTIEVKDFLQKQGIKGFLVSQKSTVYMKPIVEPLKVQSSSEAMVDIKNIVDSKKNLLNLYKPDPELIDGLDKQDINKVKAVIKYYIGNKSYSVEDILLTILYCYEKSPHIFEEYIVTKARKPIIDDKNQWNEAYLSSQKNCITNNFSIKRLLHLVNVLDFIRGKGDEHQLLSQSSEIHSHNSSKKDFVSSNMIHKGKNSLGVEGDVADKESRQSNFTKIVIAVGGVVLIALTALFLLI